MANPTYLEWFGKSEFVVAMDPLLDRRSVVDQMKVNRETYGWELAERMVSAFFGGLLDLRNEYATYYAREYPDIRTFLLCKHNLSEETVENLLLVGTESFLGRGDMLCGGEYVLNDWIQIRGGREVLEHALNCKEGTDEDTE